MTLDSQAHMCHLEAFYWYLFHEEGEDGYLAISFVAVFVCVCFAGKERGRGSLFSSRE